MFTKAKYVVGEVPAIVGTFTVAICFSEAVGHDTVKPLFKEIHSAGFFYINDDRTVVAYGESVSLKTKSRCELDAKLIAYALALQPLGG